ncbi:MAG TPA: hypothetical protein VMM13_00115 [Euzebya sp.]|nr:hypothetical protein [Euzebya sp.]
MVDFTKKVRNKAADTFEPGEQVQVSVVVQPQGDALKHAVAGGVGGLLGAGIASAVGKGKSSPAPEGTWASQFPRAKVFMTVTDQRVAVHSFGAMTGSPKDLVLSIPRDAVAGLQVSKGKVVHKATLAFTDGSNVLLDVLRGGDVNALGPALGQPEPPASV